MEWRGFVFLCCVEGVESTLVFYNWKFRNSFPRLLWCVLRFGGFSCVCWGYADSNCRVRDACWCLDPVGLWRGWCSLGLKKNIGTAGGVTRWATPQSVRFNTVGGAVGCTAVSICYFILCGFDFIMDPGGWVRAVALNPRSQSLGDYDSCV